MSEDFRVALLIDTDNISDAYADELFKGVAAYGNIIVRKGYGVFQTTGGIRWRKEIILGHAIEPVARHAYASGKNITDFALVIDALDLAYREIVDVICIVSNDSDFSLLAMKLREIGVKVCGFGTRSASKAFVNACEEFVRLGPKQNESPELIKEDSNATEDSDDSIHGLEEKDIRKVLAEACEHCHDDNGWVHLAEVGGYLKRINPAFSAKNYGDYKTLTELVKNLEEYDINYDPDRLETKIKKKA